MNYSFMRFEAVSRFSGERTLVALKSLLLFVLLFVIEKIFLLEKQRRAKMTLKQLGLRFMGFFEMFLQTIIRFIHIRAYRTLKRVIRGVQGHVASE